MDGQQAAPPVPADTRAALFAAMSELQSEFAAAAVDIDLREAALKAAIADIRHLLRDGIGKPVLAPSHVLARFMTNFNSELAGILQDWLDRIEKHDRNTSFRKGFTDSFVVFVLGKVKAGKSSLGNYMAYGCSKPEGTPIAGTRPHFFTVAMVQGTEHQAEAAVGQGGYFRVGVGETTKTIQGFRIPGLTWVDSPGLHSTKYENGALASDYADVADLIVYPMHSGNPGRAGDISEIQELLHAKKRVLIIITQCDKAEQDEAPDGTIIQNWVMKDRAARQGQIEYVRRAVAASGNAISFEILSLSVRHAETHVNDPTALNESGIAEFCHLLTDIAHSEGVQCKRETPSRNLDHFVDLVLGADAHGNSLSVTRVLVQLGELRKKLKAATAEVDRRADQVVAAVLDRIGPMVADQIKRHANDKNQTGFERGCTDALRQIIAEETRKGMLTLLSTTDGALVPTVDLTQISGFLKFKTLTVKIPKSNHKVFGAVGKAGGGIAGAWAGAELGFVAGSVLPGAGNLIGAAVGGMLGALFGSVAGNATGEALGSEWEETMQSGDNRAEVEAVAVKALQDAGQVAVQKFFLNLKGAAIKPVYRRAARLGRKLDQFSKTLKTKVHSNGRPVPACV
jgi:predicted GTPase